MVFGLFKGFGRWPAEYNPRVHGPYDPAVYYGKKDTPFGEVKLGELGEWFGRRNKTPRGVIGAISRAHWRWLHKYLHPKRGGITFYVHFVLASMTLFYIINYEKLRYHKHYKYHW